VTVGQHLDLRLFLEGIEIPVISANIQSAKNAAAVASIQIPANDYVLDLKPRTLVHLFFKDLYNGSPPESLVSVRGPAGLTYQRREVPDPELEGLFPPERFQSTPDQDQVDLENDQYKLCFGGEVVGVQFQKTPGSRGVVLQCVDWTSYWDIAYQYQVSGYSLGRGGIRAAFTGAATSVFNDFLEGSADQVMRIFQTPPRSWPSQRGSLLGALMHVIEAIGGVYFGERAVRGTNDWFSLAEMRLHLTQMVGANPYRQSDEIRLMRARGFGSLFRRNLSQLGKLVTIRAVLNSLQRYIFHEHVPITTPRFIPALQDPNLPRYETLTLEGDEETRALARAARQVKGTAEELKQRQENSTDVEAAESQSRQRGNLTTQIRSAIRTCDRAARSAGLVGVQGEGETRLGEFFTIPEIRRAFASSSRDLGAVLQLLRRRDDRRGQFPVVGSLEAVEILLRCDAIIERMQETLDSRHRRRVQRRSSQPDPPPRLLMTIYRPDVWMVSPPRCNVIFPELYSNFTYGRNFQAEVTRLLLRTHSAFFGSDFLFDGYFMAPSRVAGARRNRPIQGGRVGRDPDYTDPPAWVARDLLQHELYTGIIPSFERMSDLNLHALRGRFARNPEGGRIAYAQLACNHIFFQYRFKSRQLSMSGKFNPYIAFGFPTVIIDKYLPIDQLTNEYDARIAARVAQATLEGEGDIARPGIPEEERQQIHEQNRARAVDTLRGLLQQRPNTHYLGTPESLVHSISASQGGTTSIQMGYARTTNERSEYLGDNTYRRRARRIRNRDIPHVVAALQPPQPGERGPRGGLIVEPVTEVTNRYTRRGRRGAADRSAGPQGRFASSSTLPLYTPNRRYLIQGRRRGTRVLVGIRQPVNDYPPEVRSLIGVGGEFQSDTVDDQVSFRAYRIVERIGVYETEAQNIPPEELVFPPWYGEHYRSNNIGALYAFFFGTGAVTDPISVVASGANAVRVAQQFDGGTISPSVEGESEAPAAERVTSVEFQERFAGGARRTATDVSTGDEAPPPGFSEVVDEGTGPPGEPDPEGPDGETTLAQVEAASPIAVGIEEVVRAYSLVKINRFDVHQFIRSYTWRPIATIVDLFGTANLEINDDGEVVRGREGFHSRAFGDFDDLRQLVGPGEGNRPQTVLGLTTRDPEEGGDSERASRDQKIAARMDTRREKRLQVLKYLNALLASRGVVG
jgi:hypothetical protein